MQLSVHCVVLIIEQLFTFTDDRLSTSRPTTGCRDWFKKQQKYKISHLKHEMSVQKRKI
jgi:hypothetical protein